MKLVISYNKEVKKVMMAIDGADEKELTFEELLIITNNVIDNNENYDLELIGFEEHPDVENNYKKIIDDILKLKDDPEIQDLKSRIDTENKEEK